MEASPGRLYVNIAMTRVYARALKGKRAHGSRPDKRGKNVTIVGAIALRGIIGTMSFKGGNVNGFDIGIQTWNDSKVYRFGATWFAYAE